MANILFVDDTEDNRNLAENYLTGKGHNISLAIHGQQGLDTLLTLENLDIIFTDHDMPIMNGLEFSRTVKTYPKYSAYQQVPIVGMGNFHDNERNYIVELLKRPFSLSDYIRCIGAYCHK